ncbi:glycosyltransferase family 4 protein [Desulfoscipio gibsoniae]|uniref:Glycosyltransferase n=1 Tax=Desulfoscipio gibsoniae DSM 7213 TaxID=767817 RepID=R4KQH3_9FIRM|nr:glycosyltransferase family 4 protein [Desulfoscipio gibsoniae]AGL03792.1 glycosyltransferase [Desulfoscipio gibsoniae DSM 7213]
MHIVQRKRIMHLITNGQAGGAQTHVYDLATNLRQQFDMHVAMGTGGPLWNNLKEQNIPVYRVPSLIRPISPRTDIQCIIQVIKLINSVRPDLICIHSSKAGILGRLAARLCGIPAIFTAHGWAFTEGVPGRQRQLYRQIERLAARWADRIICVSEYDRLLALQYGVGRAEKLVTIHNGASDIGNKYRARPNGANPVRLIMVARFSKQKDQQLLLQALGALPADKNYQLDLVGDGPLWEKCRETAAGLGLEDKVNFLGARNDVPALLARAHIFVLISQWEGFPISILEAMRACLPVIATDVGGINEAVVDEETGFLVNRNDMANLQARLQELIDNPGWRLAMGQNGYSRYRQNFSLQAMLAKTAMVYNQVLNKSKDW